MPVSNNKIGENMSRKISLGDGRYKVSHRGLDCSEAPSLDSINEDLLTADDVVLGCNLCHELGLALRARLAKEKGILKKVSRLVREQRNISDDELCWFVECTDAQIECQGCGHSAEAITERIDDIADNRVVYPSFRPPVVVGDVGSSFWSPGS
ncbi:MAG: hypothetical protein Q7S53_03830 [bacterium]|nr:hypothetical protein [bacterium]